MIKAWYKSGMLRMRIGVITDTYCDYYELKDMETGEYVIKHKTDCELIS